MTALAVAATATTKLRVGSYVFVNDYRNPALLAREIATLDQLSDGRVELGLGAGNWPGEYQQLGIPFDKAGVRVSRFAEGLSIIKQFFTSETVNFSGKYYTTTALRPVPRPVQQPHPPILIGSAGRRMLTIAAREADIILPISTQQAELEEKIGWIREAAGERFEHLELGQAAFGIELTDGPVAAAPPLPGNAGRIAPNDHRAGSRVSVGAARTSGHLLYSGSGRATRELCSRDCSLEWQVARRKTQMLPRRVGAIAAFTILQNQAE